MKLQDSNGRNLPNKLNIGTLQVASTRLRLNFVPPDSTKFQQIPNFVKPCQVVALAHNMLMPFVGQDLVSATCNLVTFVSRGQRLDARIVCTRARHKNLRTTLFYINHLRSVCMLLHIPFAWVTVNAEDLGRCSFSQLCA